jgi:hypothetical protein
LKGRAPCHLFIIIIIPNNEPITVILVETSKHDKNAGKKEPSGWLPASG